MVIYKKYDINGVVRYSKDKVQTKSDRVPQVVKDTLNNGVDTMQFDDQPEKARCLFCDEPATHSRLVANQFVPLGDYCYYNKNIGKITQRLNELKKGQDNGNDTHSQQRKAPRLQRAKS